MFLEFIEFVNPVWGAETWVCEVLMGGELFDEGFDSVVEVDWVGDVVCWED